MDKARIDYRLYVITDRPTIADRDLCTCVEAAIDGGATIIQLREKSLSSREFYEIAKKIKAVTRKRRIPFIINDRLDIALAVDADGLHLGQDDLPLAVARKLLASDKIIGVSASTVPEALLAQKQGADYLGVGAMFTTPTKHDANYISLVELQQIKEAVTIPVVAIGGITQANAASVLATGIAGVAVVSAVLGREDIRQAAAEFGTIITACRGS
jgi:thiamine-phosphate pyrophosphorylase